MHITQEVSRILETLCQELGTKTKYIILITNILILLMRELKFG